MWLQKNGSWSNPRCFPSRPTAAPWKNGLIESGGNLRLIYGGFLRFASALSGGTINVKRKPTAPARKPRADSARNRQLLIDAAKAGFADVGLNVSLEEIARRAGVGIGTLYRHFPSREAVVEAVYRREVEQLPKPCRNCSKPRRAGEALHQWMHLFVDYIATKRLIAPSLGAAAGADVRASCNLRGTDHTGDLHPREARHRQRRCAQGYRSV